MYGSLFSGVHPYWTVFPVSEGFPCIAEQNAMQNVSGASQKIIICYSILAFCVHTICTRLYFVNEKVLDEIFPCKYIFSDDLANKLWVSAHQLP